MRSDERMEGLGEIDQRIDAALRSYAEPGQIPEARVALARILARADAIEVGRRKLWWWAVAASAAACLVVAVVVGAGWVLRGPRVPEIAWAPGAPGVVQGDNKTFPPRLKPEPVHGLHGTAEAVPLQSHESSRRGLQLELRADRLPKLDVFPTPRPLTNEEQALMAFGEQAPPEIKKQVIEAAQHVSDPIAIAELTIRPLDAGEKKDSEKEKEKR